MYVDIEARYVEANNVDIEGALSEQRPIKYRCDHQTMNTCVTGTCVRFRDVFVALGYQVAAMILASAQDVSIALHYVIRLDTEQHQAYALLTVRDGVPHIGEYLLDDDGKVLLD